MEKILFIAKNIPVPGLSTNNVILQIAELLRKRDNQIEVIFPKEYVPPGLNFHPKYKHLTNLKSWSVNELKITPFTYPRLPLNNQAFRLLKLTNAKLDKLAEKHKDCSVVHGHYLLPDGWMANRISKRLKVPSVITVRTSDVTLLMNSNKRSHTWKIAKDTVQKADKIHTLNGPVKRFINEKFKIKATVIPHGFDDSLINKNPISEKTIDVLVVAEAIERKRVDWVIKAFKTIVNKANLYGRKMVIIGDGPLLNSWKKLAGDSTDIVFTGKISHNEVMKYMDQSRIFALPSYNETFGLVYLEAAFHGNAIIALRGEGIDGIFNEEDGVKFVDNYSSFYSTFSTLLLNKNQADDMGMSAKIKAKYYTWDRIINQYLSFYQSALDS